MKHYSLEFKQEAIKLVHDEGYSVNKAANHLGVSPQTLRAWINKFCDDSGTPVDVSKVTQQEQEIRRLKEENRQLKMERDILKKVEPGKLGRRECISA